MARVTFTISDDAYERLQDVTGDVPISKWLRKLVEATLYDTHTQEEQIQVKIGSGWWPHIPEDENEAEAEADEPDDDVFGPGVKKWNPTDQP